MPLHNKPSYTRQIAAYTSGRELKHHERALIDLISARVGDQENNKTFLDVGCADGLFLSHVQDRYPQWRLEGLEANEELIERGTKSEIASQIVLHHGDAYDFVPDNAYDVIAASGILAVFDDPLSVLERWISWLKPGGRMFVYSIFNVQDIDTRVYFRNNFLPNGWETGLTGFSVQSTQRHLEQLGVEFEFIPFDLPVDLPKSENPIRSYTVRTEDGRRLVIAGNILCEFHHLVISKPVQCQKAQ